MQLDLAYDLEVAPSVAVGQLRRASWRWQTELTRQTYRRDIERYILPASVREKSLPYPLDVNGLTAHLCVSRRHIYRLVNERRVPHLKFSLKLRFDPTKIAAWLEEAERLPSGRLK